MADRPARGMLAQEETPKSSLTSQTAVANNIAPQTQAAAATSQWYTDQERQREEQRQGPIAFLWMWCFPIFVLLFAGLVLWGLWRWLKNQQTNQFILENPVDRLPAPTIEIVPHQHGDDSLPYVESDVVVDSRYQPTTKPDDQMRRWLDEVKRKLLSSDKEDEDDETHN